MEAKDWGSMGGIPWMQSGEAYQQLMAIRAEVVVVLQAGGGPEDTG